MANVRPINPFAAQRDFSWVKTLLLILLLAAAYFITGEISFAVSVSHSIVTIVIFAAEGIALGMVLLYGYRLWPGIFIGQFLLASANDLAPLIAGEIAAINSLEAILAVYLFRKFNLNPGLNRLRDILGLHILIFTILQPFSATLGVGTLWLHGNIPDHEFTYSWFSWWLGNSIGQLLITPIILILFSKESRIKLSLNQAMLITMVLLPLSWVFFSSWPFQNLTLVFAIIFPLVILIAAFGAMAAASLSTLFITAVVVYLSSHGYGPFYANDTLHLIDLNFFIIGIALASQIFSVLFFERKIALSNLQNDIDLIDNFVIFFTTDLNWKITQVSRAFCRISGYSKNELLGNSIFLIHGSDFADSIVNNKLVNLRQNKIWEGEIFERRKNGTNYWAHMQIIRILDEKGDHVGYRSICEDISDKKQVETLSITDQLTGLFNRRKVDDSLRHELNLAQRYDTPFAILLLDIDHFKYINDQYGHQTGDEILREFSAILRNNVRITDTLGRWGGEEFIIILPETAIEGATTTAEKIRQDVEGHDFSHEKSITVSIGITCFMESDSAESMMNRVDEALYHAKKSGRNQVAIKEN